VLGLDPDPGALWPGFEVHTGSEGTPAQMAASAVREHCFALIEATAHACVAIKPQLARFEVLGAPGREALQAVVERAHARELIVILDAKRGDIDVTAAAYASALYGGLETPYGHLDGLGGDLVTVNPLMGRDAIEPFLEHARATGAGVLLLVRTSNLGAADFEDLELASGETLWERVAALVGELGSEHVGASGISDVGAVVGATEPAHLQRARELMPHAAFLLPGIGAQGGRVEDLRAAFLPGPAGGLVSASRSIAGAYLKRGGEPAAAAAAEAERLCAEAWQLADGVLAGS
jgi:orotidine-5'-phosphate decarboxylase